MSLSLSLLKVPVLALSATVITVAALAPREAVSEERRGRGGGEVCVYEHAGYGGWEHCYGVGESDRDLGNRRNQISSVRIRGRAAIELYEHPNFQGREAQLTTDVPDIRQWRKSWNDEVDSLRVTASDYRGGGPDRRDDRVCVYQHVNYQGNSQCWDSGDDIRDLRGIGWNDGISSIRTFGRTRVAVYEDADFRGERLVVEQDIPDLTQMAAGNRGNWNDRISSLRVSGDRWRRH
jgi:peptidase inhibitor family I36